MAGPKFVRDFVQHRHFPLPLGHFHSILQWLILAQNPMQSIAVSAILKEKEITPQLILNDLSE